MAAYSPLDPPAVRQRVYDRALTAVTAKFPVANERFSLAPEDLRYEGQENYTLTEQHDAVLNGKTLSRRMKGTWVLRDLAGKEISRSGRRTIMNVPYLTDRGTFIRNGNELLLAYQMRLQPGVYTRRAADGVPEAHVNARQGTGPVFKIRMDPETSVFHLNWRGRKMPLYPIMLKLGLNDDDMEAVWGKDILKANRDAGRSMRQARTAPTPEAFPRELATEKGQTSQEDLDAGLQKT